MVERLEKGINPWLERNFQPECPTRTPGKFADSVKRRMEGIGNLGIETSALRTAVRERLGVSDNTPLIVYGEQPVGLNEPAGVIVGKRVLAHMIAAFWKGHIDRKAGVKHLDIRADSDVITSEPGLYKLTVPDPSRKEGVTRISWLPIDGLYQIPTMGVRVGRERVRNVVGQLKQIYDPRSTEFLVFEGHLWDILEQQDEINYAGFMNKLLDVLLLKLGLQSPRRVSDIELDSLIAQLGGLDLILEYWPEIIELSNRYNQGEAKIPDKDTAPFHTYLENLENKPRLVVKIDNGQNFFAVNPLTNKIVESFTRDDVMNGNFPIAFRAIPRVLLLAMISDGHITGGGAMYNNIAKKVFEEIFKVPYFPLAWMDLNDEAGNRRGLFQYQSAALRGKNSKLPGFGSGSSAVERGEVSALDLFLSLSPNAEELVRQQVFKNPDFNMGTRIFF